MKNIAVRDGSHCTGMLDGVDYPQMPLAHRADSQRRSAMATTRWMAQALDAANRGPRRRPQEDWMTAPDAPDDGGPEDSLTQKLMDGAAAVPLDYQMARRIGE